MTCTGIHTLFLLKSTQKSGSGGCSLKSPALCSRAASVFWAAPSMHILGCCSHPFAHAVSEPYNASLYTLLQHIPPSPTVAMLRSGPNTTLVAFSS